MINYLTSQIINEFLFEQTDVFTVDDLVFYVKSKGKRIKKSDAEDFLRASNNVFPLIVVNGG